MINSIALALDKKKIISLTQFIALIGVASIVPLFHQQMITGPIVNATLFAAAILLGSQMGIFVGLIPSVIALSVGLLSPVLAPMIPYIMISNAILILTFNAFRNRNFWLAVGVASFMKFLFLFSTSSLVMSLILKKEMADSVAMMMSWPQLVTALVGGMIAWAFFRKSQN